MLNDADGCGVSGGRWAGKTRAKENSMCIWVCLRKSYYGQRLSVMRLDMGTINSFCLDDGVRKIYSCEAVIKLMTDI